MNLAGTTDGPYRQAATALAQVAPAGRPVGTAILGRAGDVNRDEPVSLTAALGSVEDQIRYIEQTVDVLISRLGPVCRPAPEAVGPEGQNEPEPLRSPLATAMVVHAARLGMIGTQLHALNANLDL